MGLARRCPHTVVEAFDIDPASRDACEEMARDNGVGDRVFIRGACSPEELNRLPLSGPLLVCDCQGYEDQLLDPAAAPGLLQCDLLVELHDFANHDITTNVLRRFSSTHHIRLIPSVNRDPNLYPGLWFLKDRRDRGIALGEQRVPMNWAYATLRGEARK